MVAAMVDLVQPVPSAVVDAELVASARSPSPTAPAGRGHITNRRGGGSRPAVAPSTDFRHRLSQSPTPSPGSSFTADDILGDPLFTSGNHRALP